MRQAMTGGRSIMMNFHNKKTKRIISGVIVGLLVFAMVVTTMTGLISGGF